ncbi:hypothetical protein GGU45_002723 [Niabella hirudinis]
MLYAIEMPNFEDRRLVVVKGLVPVVKILRTIPRQILKIDCISTHFSPGFAVGNACW